MTMDTIRLNNIEALCIIGDLPEERDREQRLLVDVILEIDLSTAIASDKLSDTVDYAGLSREIRDALRAAKCRLIERAAGVVADVCLEDPRIQRVTVCVKKAGCVPGLGSAEVRITRD